jgi:hypothetical protein
MIFELLALAAVQSEFLLVDRADPITEKRQVALATSADENMLIIGCSSVGARELFIRFTPKSYYGPARDELFWKPNVIYRFGNEKADSDLWTFYSDYIELGDIFGTNLAKAQFLDRLAKNSVLHIRYEARQGSPQTVSFLYSISSDQLAFVVRTCDPKRVQEALRKMGSVLVTKP